ncbi:uncharacterized protein LOC133867822 [Alnus glutinosa]|uniref:uncharacterized protein LOC133867822 n=1 Tax=Alnus glutinosa TaxID=3517 RepID=UPI002D78845A|nr:uncharacterized protein LOC133867822 [Alnus glutinosa]
MANWDTLFDKVITAKDARERALTTYRREEYRSFAYSIPAEINHNPPPFEIELHAIVMFRDQVYEHCTLEYKRFIDRGSFKLIIYGGGDLNLSQGRRIDAKFRWIGTRLEIKLELAVSPEVQMDLNQEAMPFIELTKKRITRDDVSNSRFRLPQTDVRPFYGICPEEVKVAIDNGSAFSVQIFPPGQEESFGADVLIERGRMGSRHECSNVTINLNHYLSNRVNAGEFQARRTLKVWYREESNKLKLAFTRPRDAQILGFPIEPFEEDEE